MRWLRYISMFGSVVSLVERMAAAASEIEAQIHAARVDGAITPEEDAAITARAGELAAPLLIEARDVYARLRGRT